MEFAKLVLEQEIITQQRLINDRESQGLPVERNLKRQSELTEALDNLTSSSLILPRTLTAENGAKALLIGEFYEDYECSYYDADNELVEYTVKVPVSWSTIKDIYKAIVQKYGT